MDILLPSLLWLVVAELLGLVALPLAMATLSRLADRGYGLAKVLGLLLVMYLNFLFGSIAGLGNNTILLALALLAILAGSVWALWAQRHNLLGWARAHYRMIVIQELLFVGLFVAWTLVRAAHPGILSTEKPMDLALMTASHKATSFPPYDPWLSGTTINYYYGGYLAIGTMVTLTGVAPAVGYNLGLILLFALVGTAAYSIAYNLMGNLRWAFLGPIFVLLVGNLDGLSQFLQHGATGFDFFHSSRIVDAGNTINEFPAFSFLEGDMHPHIIALPFTILVIGVALQLALAPAGGWAAFAEGNIQRGLTLGLAGLSAGALYFMNTWDWPTYLFLLGAAVVLPALSCKDRRPLGEGVTIAAGILILSYVFYFPFHQSFSPLYSSFGLEAHGSPTGQVFIMFGLFLLPVATATLVLIGHVKADAVPAPELASVAATGSAVGVASAGRSGGTATRPAREIMLEEDEDALNQQLSLEDLPDIGPGGRRRVILVGCALVLWVLLSWIGHLGTIGLLLPLCAAASYLAWQEARQEHRLPAFGLLLCAMGLALVMLVDVFYLKDIFCGSLDAAGNCTGNLYRMNTVFKFYYQAWALLALGAGYCIYILGVRLAGYADLRRFVMPGAATVLALAGGVYMVLSLMTPTTDPYTNPVANAAATLDGAAYLRSYSGPPQQIATAIPADAAAIKWLNETVSGHPTILEADQIGTGPQDYWPYPGTSTQELMMSRISVFTGLPDVLGWGYSHEGLWHGDGVVSTRFTAVQTMYTTTNLATLGALLSQYKVSYIYLGQIEAYTYYGNKPGVVAAALARFQHFGSIVYSRDGVTIIHTTFGSE